MSMEYSHREDKHIDTDYVEVYYLTNGDCISMDNDSALLSAYKEGLISKTAMVEELEFDENDL